MSSTTSDEEEHCFGDERLVLYRDRPEWRDVTPVPQDDGPNPVVSIAYSERFKDVHDYLRAVVRSGECSERALQLTADAIMCNPANYTVWNYRRKIIETLKKDVNEELKFTLQIIEDQPKNYQVWYHRQKMVEWGGSASVELELTEKVLDEDAKNYHAWQHRQWVITTYKLWDGELEFVERLLQEDFRNNSAWNQRHFVITNTSSYTHEVLKNEIEYASKYVRKAPNNESSWNYLRGILRGQLLLNYPEVEGLCLELYAKNIRSPFLLGMLVEVFKEKATEMTDTSTRQTYLDKATNFCVELCKMDSVHTGYWNYIQRKLLAL